MNVHTITLTYKSEGGTTIISEDEFECDLSLNIEREIPVGATDIEVTPVDIPSADVIGFAFGCKKVSGEPSSATAQLQIETNDSTSPDDTIVVTPEAGLGWANSWPTAIPLSADVTKLYVTNQGTAKAELVVRAGIDATPAI